ncbi:DUF530 domain-containing protein [Methanothermobacter wolfeii]|uniref:DUF530 domain-containing protein n=1 Tax=Methanothermobacter wolfeii TaxID=145261 RepID=A0A9E7RR91_METWO|nr:MULTISPECIES: DUF530 domain-containing protein [Methanothermobacter]QHN06405.1 DUF530 domain-containing protein [Methanothermobacter sp. THM-1]UXH30888.1 DUF530 domain-containing protein [Methanothermobacter wolfeii]SCM57225.1 putative protein MJ1110 [Methanothermobacter wolfeii]
MNESGLIARSERFLESIKSRPVTLDEIRSREGFFKIYRYLRGNLDELQDLKETMELRGFKYPFRSISGYGAQYSGEVAEDIHDIKRHAQYFRMKASAKKNLLDRVNSAISSHRIALGNLEEYGLLRCSECSRLMRLGEFELDDIHDGMECPCGSGSLEPVFSSSAICRVEIIPYLPLSGDYMVKMSELSLWAREAFKKIMRLFKNEKKGAVKSATLVIRVLEDGRWIRRRITIDSDDDDYERMLREKYGPDVRIEFMQFHRKKSSIINDRYTRASLAIAYAGLSYDIIREIRDDVYHERLGDYESVRRYREMVFEARTYSPEFTGSEDELREIRIQKLHQLLHDSGLAGPDGGLIPSLERDLKAMDRIKRELFRDVPVNLVLWDVARYYLGTSYDRRSKYSGPFPNLRPVLDRNQARTFNEFSEGAVELLNRYWMDGMVYIENLGDVLLKKFEIEEKMKGLHMKPNPAAFGAAVLHMEAGLDMDLCAGLFNVTVDELLHEKASIENLGKPSTDKARMFLDIIKGD